jgi:hypothetical protein
VIRLSTALDEGRYVQRRSGLNKRIKLVQQARRRTTTPQGGKGFFRTAARKGKRRSGKETEAIHVLRVIGRETLRRGRCAGAVVGCSMAKITSNFGRDRAEEIAAG